MKHSYAPPHPPHPQYFVRKVICVCVCLSVCGNCKALSVLILLGKLHSKTVKERFIIIISVVSVPYTHTQIHACIHKQTHTHTYTQMHVCTLFFFWEEENTNAPENKKEIVYLSSHNFTNKLCHHQFKIRPITHCLQLLLSEKQKIGNILQPGPWLNKILIELTLSLFCITILRCIMCHYLLP